jgi:hypothetical protein
MVCFKDFFTDKKLESKGTAYSKKQAVYAIPRSAMNKAIGLKADLELPFFEREA